MGNKDTYIAHQCLHLGEFRLVVGAGIDITAAIRDLLDEDVARNEAITSRVDLIHEDRQRMLTRLQAVIDSVTDGEHLDGRFLTRSL